MAKKGCANMLVCAVVKGLKVESVLVHLGVTKNKHHIMHHRQQIT